MSRSGLLVLRSVPALLGLAACGGSSATDPELPGGEEPASISILRGNEQTAPAGTALSQQIVVLVRDGDGTALPGAAVSWTTSAGGSFEPSTTETDADGLAAAPLTVESYTQRLPAEARHFGGSFMTVPDRLFVQ